MAAQPFFYDGQIRRFLLQFTRMFSNFQAAYGYDDDGNPTYIKVPIRYGDASRQASTILQDASANNMPCAPMFSFYINSLKYDRPRIQEPYFVDKKHINQRTWDETNQEYRQTQGNAFTVERIMPVPYVMGLTLDLWTTSTDMKLQISEQIFPLFNPSLEIQSTDNYLDWTSLSVVEIEDNQWSSRSIPAGADDNLDISSLKFKLPIWISPPAKVTKQGVIHKIIASVFDESGDVVNAIQNDDLLMGTRLEVTPHGYKILLIDNQLQILKVTTPIEMHTKNLDLIEPEFSNIKWHPVVDEYGVLNNGISKIRITLDDGHEIYGNVTYHPTDDNFLIYDLDIDSLPKDSQGPISAIINPIKSGPNAGLPAPVVGTRYLLTHDIGYDGDLGDTGNDEYALAWVGTGGNNELVAREHDIVEWDGTKWFVTFDIDATDREYVTNVTTGIQLRWTGEAWVKSYAGYYEGGDWSIIF